MDLSAIQFNKVSALTTAINTELLRMPILPGTLTAQLAWVRNGADVKGGTTVFPIPLWGNEVKERSPYEEVANSPPVTTNLQSSVKEWAPDGEKIPRGTQIADIYGIFEQNLPMILDYAGAHQDTLTTNLLGAGESTTHVYDQRNFFDTTKYVNPVAQKGQYANYNGALRLDRQGLVSVFDSMDAVPGPDGVIRPIPGDLLVVVSTEDQLDRASVYLNGTMRAAAVGNAAASESNGSLMGRAQVIKAPMLRNYNGGKAWYVFRRVSGMHRPLMFSTVQPPQIHIEGLSQNEHTRVTRNVINYGWRGFYGVDFAYAQFAYKCIEP